MQATVFSASEPDGVTQVVLDDGLTLSVEPYALAESALLQLRPGQRVSVEVTGGTVSRLWIVGIGEGEVIR